MVLDKQKKKKKNQSKTVYSIPLNRWAIITFQICSKSHRDATRLNIFAISSVLTSDPLCHRNFSSLVPGSLGLVWALLSFYGVYKRGWMNVLNHPISLLEEFKLLQVQETAGLSFCFLTLIVALNKRLLYDTQVKIKQCASIHVPGHPCASARL